MNDLFNLFSKQARYYQQTFKIIYEYLINLGKIQYNLAEK